MRFRSNYLKPPLKPLHSWQNMDTDITSSSKEVADILRTVLVATEYTLPDHPATIWSKNMSIKSKPMIRKSSKKIDQSDKKKFNLNKPRLTPVNPGLINN